MRLLVARAARRTGKVKLSEVQRLITLHEFGGVGGADLIQAGDSLSFLETLQDIVRKWVTHGECGVEQARAKHRYMAERIRVPAAEPIAERLPAASAFRPTPDTVAPGPPECPRLVPRS